ncbi:hypothetical protein DFQ14_103113 [Halopolyspora algeriensis]|uniref:Uncharacterized protein n=2 Tax=Halopolyspora algeriensis TaxID=1500506 RepID=A0A368VTR2_9ACTN|nr:hypothetical protein DFQ14_103113 [Halopolyspora algeriensis]TQM53131.1 hypothetical protein FHU43_2511 [Halopolyspora algeriensis]
MIDPIKRMSFLLAAESLHAIFGAMNDETRIALRNYDWMVRNRGLDGVELYWESDTVVYGDGGTDIDTLCERGFTPATSE